MVEISGQINGSGMKIGIVAARFNGFVVERLADGAMAAFDECGVRREDIDLVRVPGAFEIPWIANRLAESGRYDAVLCLGAVIRGETAHFDYVAGECSRGVAEVGLRTGVPVIFGVLTTDTVEQAIERAGTKAGNKGREAALVALEMVDLLKSLPT